MSCKWFRAYPRSDPVLVLPVGENHRWDYPPELRGDKVVDDNWVAQYDPASGKTYYYHKITKQTRWDNPNAPAEAKKPESPWKTTVDPASGKTYYYNRETRETRWTKPEELEDDSDDGTALLIWGILTIPFAYAVVLFDRLQKRRRRSQLLPRRAIASRQRRPLPGNSDSLTRRQ